MVVEAGFEKLPGAADAGLENEVLKGLDLPVHNAADDLEFVGFVHSFMRCHMMIPTGKKMVPFFCSQTQKGFRTDVWTPPRVADFLLWNTGPAWEVLREKAATNTPPIHFPIMDLLIFSPASFRERICSCIFLSASSWG